MKHKILLSLVALLTALSAQAYSFQSGDLYYNKTSYNTVEVTYQDYFSSTNYQGLTTAIIPSSVTVDGKTYSVTSIGRYAFEKCSSLTSITIPNSVTSIEGSAFNGCSSLTSIVVESGNTMYDSRENCNAIIETASNTLIAGCQSTTIPNSVTSIGGDAFYNCSGLTSITIPNNVTSMASFAFYGCSGLTSVTIPNSVTSIGRYAFWGCFSLTSITIPNSVTSIGDRAFQNCSSLTSITIPNSVKSIEEGAFEGCFSLTSVTIPNSVTSIGNEAFSRCPSLTSVTIPNSVTNIGEWAFFGCSGLTSVTIPNSVTSIGYAAFKYCSGLTSVTIPNSVTSIGEYAFEGCSSLTSVTIPNSVTRIGTDAFYNCSGLTSITIPNSVTSIGYGAFYNCSGLTSITIPNSVTSIGGNAFSDCVQLTSITCEAKTPPSCNISSNNNSFKNIPTNCTINVPCGCLEAYNTAPWYNYQLAIIPPLSLQVQPSSESLGSTKIDQEVDCDSTAIVSATAAVGYHFVQWNDGVTENPRLIVLTKDTNLTAEFAKNAYNITLTHDGEGAIEGNTTALYQDTIALNAVADYGWQFSGWSDGVLDNPRSIVVTADCEYHAIFVRQQFSLTAIAENGVVDGVGTFAYEDTCQLTATPAVGYHFVQWSDGITENPRSIVLTKDTNLTAEFAKNSYQITISHTGNGMTMGDTTALYQDTITLSALADYGWEFSGWEDGNTENPRVVVATEDKDYKAIFVKRNFTIATAGENGTIAGGGTYAYETNCSLTATPAVGYHFVQWNDGVTENPRSIVLTKDTNLTAEFAKNSYRIYLTYEGEGVIEGDTTALYQDLVTLTAVADYGWQFSGWSDGVLDNPRSIVVTADCEYHAIFVRQQFRLTAIAENGVVDGVGTFAYEDTCQLTATPNTGYHFVQWNDGITENPRTIVLTQDTNLTAEFARNVYNITLTQDGEGTIESDTTALYQDTIALNAVADYGWQFSGWSDGVLDNPRSIVVTADCEYHVIFVRQQFSLTAIAENGVVDGVGTFVYEDTCQLTATPNTGYHFVQWCDGVTENPRSIVLTKDTNLTAEFARNAYNITLTYDGEGTIESDTTALYQDTIALNAVAYYGWQFSGWSDGVLDNLRSIVVTADCEYHAIFVKRSFTITVAGENGTIEGAGTFEYETTCQLTATPDFGYHFVKWSDGITDNPRSIVLTQDTMFTAEFARNSYHILTSYEGAGKVEGDSTALYKDSVTLTAVPDYGWEFRYWNENNVVRLDNPRKVEVTADCSFKAIFVKRNFNLSASCEHGTIAGGGTYAYETNCSLTATPAVGYHFVQWSDGVTENPRSIVLTKDTNLTAEFAKNSYRIYLTYDGKGSIEGDTIALYQDSVTLAAIADYGWQFSSWSDGITDNPRTVVVSSDCAYQAIFVKRSFTITVAGENGTIEGAGTFEYETTCQLSATPAVGYHFVQWSDGITDNPRSIVLTKYTNLTAEFAKNSYRIYLTHEGEGAIEGDTTALYKDSVILTAVADYGWQFSDWSDGVLDNPRSIVVTADCEYHAIFVRQQFSLTAIAENGVVDGVGTFAYGDTCQLIATPNTGYHFVQWSDGITENPRTIVLTKDTNLTVEFAKNSYQITTSHTGNGMTMGDTTALYQDTITLSALADYGWDFSGWEDGNTDNPRVVVATEDKDYKAIFVKRMFTITLTGENSTFEGAGSFAYGDTCQLTAIANVGYHFVQWGDSITDNPRSIVLTQDTMFTAEFAKNYSGQCGDSLYWSYDTTTISITGSGAMYNYSDSLMPWYLFRDSITAVEMVKTATTIGDNAFANCSKLSKLTISEGIESVGANAFMGCTQLTNITCHPIIPPYAETSSFENYDTYLRVPCSSKSQYMADAVWGQFKHIECIEEETDIESVESESSEQSVRKIYRDGHIYILRDGEEYSILGQKL